MALYPNQFKQGDVLGRIDNSLPGGQTTPVVIHTGTLVPGDPLKFQDSARGGLPRVIKAAADTDDIIGYVPYNQKEGENGYDSGERCEALLFGGIVILRATAAFVRGTSLMIDLGATGGVKTATTNKTIVGRALDKASADGDLVRVWLFAPLKTLSA